MLRALSYLPDRVSETTDYVLVIFVRWKKGLFVEISYV